MKKARRFAATEPHRQQSKSNRESGKKPLIPNYILHRINPPSARRDLVCWREIYNLEGRTIRQDELTLEEEKPKGAKKSSNPQKKDNKPFHKNCNVKYKQTREKGPEA